MSPPPSSRQDSASPFDTPMHTPSDVRPHTPSNPDTPPPTSPRTGPYSPSATTRTRTFQLPPIRTVLGEQLALPTPSSYSPRSTQSVESRGSVREREQGGEDARYPGASSGSDGSRSGASSCSDRRRLGEPHQYREDSRSSSRAVAHPVGPSTNLSFPTGTRGPSFAATHDPAHAHRLSFPSLPFPRHAPPSSTEYSTHSAPSFPTPRLVSASFPPSRSPPSHTALPQSTTRSDCTPLPPYPSSPFAFPPAAPHTAPAYLHILRPSPSGELITGPPVIRVRTRPGAVKDGEGGKSARDGRLHGEDAASMRRHVCPLCQKRFNRPSSLKTHQSVHTGSRPFACPYKGCSRVFSVASNMRRHYRKHEATHEAPPTHAPGHPHSSPPEHALDSLGSSEGEGEGEGEGDMDVEVGDEHPQRRPSMAGVASSSRLTSSPAVRALPVPGAYFQWTSAPVPGVHGAEDVVLSEAHGAEASGAYESEPVRSRAGFVAARYAGAGTGRRGARNRPPRHASR